MIVKNPHKQSQAALVLLTKILRDQEIQDWLDFRDNFLRRHKLVCYFCGKPNLKIEVDMTNKSKLKYLATIDHLIPRSKGGNEYDETNLVVACFPCNQEKDDNANFNPRR